MALLTLVISSPGSDCIKWERKLKKGGAKCKHRPPPKMTHQQDLTKSRFYLSAISEAIVSRRIRKSLMDALRSHFGQRNVLVEGAL